MYRRHLGAPVEFEAAHAALAIDRADLDLPLGEHNEELRALAVDYLTVRFPAPAHVVPGPGPQRWSSGCWARGPAATPRWPPPSSMHPRTLQRRLREEGTTFEDIKDEARRALAERYLAHPDVPLAQVTAALDYSEQSALTRSCQRWFHTTPSGAPGQPRVRHGGGRVRHDGARTRSDFVRRCRQKARRCRQRASPGTEPLPILVVARETAYIQHTANDPVAGGGPRHR